MDRAPWSIRTWTHMVGRDADGTEITRVSRRRHCTESPHPCRPSAASKGEASYRAQLHGTHVGVMPAAAARSKNAAQRVERINMLRRDGTWRRVPKRRTSRRIHLLTCLAETGVMLASQSDRGEHRGARWNTSSSEVRVLFSYFVREEGPWLAVSRRGVAFASGEGGPLYC